MRTFHAVALFCVGLIAIAMPHTVAEKLAPPPTFDAAADDATADDIGRFDPAMAAAERDDAR